MKVQDKVAVVTGGASGIGKGCVEELLKSGAKLVAILDISVDEGEKTRRDLQTIHGERLQFYQCDVTNKEQVDATYRTIFNIHKRLDIALNSAGVSEKPDWRITLDINLVGVINCTLIAKELMLQNDKDGGGVIINLASAAGLFPFHYEPVYVASKYGVIGFSRAIALNPELQARNIRTNMICPTYVDTPMHQANKIKAIENPEYKVIIDAAICVPIETVIETFMKLVENDACNDTVMLITPAGVEEQKYMATDEILRKFKLQKS